jgi:hypothetical protein
VDEALRRKICVLVSIGCDLRQAAIHAGCSYPTIRRETLRHAEFGRRLRQALKLKPKSTPGAASIARTATQFPSFNNGCASSQPIPPMVQTPLSLNHLELTQVFKIHNSKRSPSIKVPCQR